MECPTAYDSWREVLVGKKATCRTAHVVNALIESKPSPFELLGDIARHIAASERIED